MLLAYGIASYPTDCQPGLRPLILVGDGAFQMTDWQLGNGRRYGLDPIDHSGAVCAE